MSKIIEQAMNEFGRLDIPVNNAAFHMSHEGIEDLPSDEIEKLFGRISLRCSICAKPLYFYLRTHGASVQKLEKCVKKPSRIDILGLDYYAHSELEWNLDVRVYPNRNPEGFASVAMEYVNRYKLPVMLTETNIRGSIPDRISRLKFMVEQCETLETRLAPQQIPFHGFCWYPFTDSTDWCSLVRRADGKIDPQGIYHLTGENLRRSRSELSDVFASLVCGAISSADIPAYIFQPPLDAELKGFLPLMKHWNWRKPFAEFDHLADFQMPEINRNQGIAEAAVY